MPFITNKKRQDLIGKVNKKYFFRKFVIILSVVLLFLLLISVLSISVCWILNFNKLLAQKLTQQEVWLKMCQKWWSPFVITNKDNVQKGEPLLISLSWLSYLFIAFGSVAFVGVVMSIILTITTKSPKQVQDCIEVLENSPLPGQLTSNISPTEVVRKRRKPLSLNKKKK